MSRTKLSSIRFYSQITAVPSNNSGLLKQHELVYLGLKGFSASESEKIRIDFEHNKHRYSPEERLECLEHVSDEYKKQGCNWTPPLDE